MKKLTIGSAVYDDFDGVYFSYQSIRLNNQDILDDLDLIIIDNNPDSDQGKTTKHFCNQSAGIKYIPYPKKKSTSIRNQIFKHAEGEFCMSIDCHVLFEPNTIKKLINFFDKNPESDDLYHGPMFYDSIKGSLVAKMLPEWRDDMFGIWGQDERANDINGDPFEIDMHGMGIFACKTSSWLGFNEKFEGFGGEEGYIHKKYKKFDRKIWCLPFLRWLHRFDRPKGVPYPLNLNERIKNYLIGHKELGIPFTDIVDHFSKHRPNINIQNLIDEVEGNSIKTTKPNNTPLCSSAMSGDIKLWENSCVKFNQPSNIRYLKYQITDSYDGHASILKVDIESDHKIEPKIQKFSSESPINTADSLLKEGLFWETNESMKGAFPHEIILDLGSFAKINKITTYPRPFMQKGLPTKFKIYGSNDSIDWHLLSNVDILKD